MVERTWISRTQEVMVKRMQVNGYWKRVLMGMGD